MVSTQNVQVVSIIFLVLFIFNFLIILDARIPENLKIRKKVVGSWRLRDVVNLDSMTLSKSENHRKLFELQKKEMKGNYFYNFKENGRYIITIKFNGFVRKKLGEWRIDVPGKYIIMIDDEDVETKLLLEFGTNTMKLIENDMVLELHDTHTKPTMADVKERAFKAITGSWKRVYSQISARIVMVESEGEEDKAVAEDVEVFYEKEKKTLVHFSGDGKYEINITGDGGVIIRNGFWEIDKNGKSITATNMRGHQIKFNIISFSNKKLVLREGYFNTMILVK